MLDGQVIFRRWLAVLFLCAVLVAIFACNGVDTSVHHYKVPPGRVVPTHPKPITSPPPPRTVFPLVVSTTELQFNTVQGRSPFDQDIQVGECTDPSGQCNWPVQLSTSTFWLMVSADQGTVTPFPVRVSILSQELGPGVYTGNITLTNPDQTSVSVRVTLTITNPPPPVIEPIQHIVSLTWQPSANAVSYNVRRADNPMGDSTPFLVLNTLPDAATSFDDNTVTSGFTYFYAVTAVGSEGQESGPSQEIQVVIPTP